MLQLNEGGVMQENIHRNFGMPQPNGYRKALRFMKHADHFGFPILTFVDTPGAYAGKTAEEQGQVKLSSPATCIGNHKKLWFYACSIFHTSSYTMLI